MPKGGCRLICLQERTKETATARKKESPADGLFDLMLLAPWWVGPLLAVAAFLLLRYAVPLALGGGGKRVGATAGGLEHEVAWLTEGNTVEERPRSRRSLFRWCVMPITEMRHFLTCLGWKAIFDGGRNGRWSVCAASCGQTVIAIADTQEEAWSAACSTALNVTVPSLRERREARP